MTHSMPPICPRDEEAVGGNAPPPDMGDRIRRLAQEIPYGVLATQGEGQPYASLVAFAFRPDLAAAVFATPRATRKYHLLTRCDRTALLVDDRCRHPGEMMAVEAITATGQVRELSAPDERAEWSRLLLTKHPHLSDFVASPSVALFRMDIIRIFHVERFQEVTEWRPPR